jgi:hypothetical protein
VDARIIQERTDHPVDLGIQARHAQQRVPLVDRGGPVAALIGQLAARHQVEDEVLALGGRLEPDVLRRLHRQRQR